MSFIDKVFEAGSWDVSLPPSPTPPSNTEQEQGGPPALSLATGSSTALPCPSPVTSPINWMSDTPSAQSTRPTNNGAKKNFVWQAQDIECCNRVCAERIWKQASGVDNLIGKHDNRLGRQVRDALDKG
ncbi:uncharacterized protein UDID_19056 [Ustilago sp. UG-2017a]|nr:uncharacterized protein UDID_19056 [Ustilago sp. UG-2017a]